MAAALATPGAGEVLISMIGDGCGDGGGWVGEGADDGDGAGDGDGEGDGEGDGDADGDGDGLGVDSSTDASRDSWVATVCRSCALRSVMSPFALCSRTSCKKSLTADLSAAASLAFAACVMAFIRVCSSACGETFVEQAATSSRQAAATSRLIAC